MERGRENGAKLRTNAVNASGSEGERLRRLYKLTYASIGATSSRAGRVTRCGLAYKRSERSELCGRETDHNRP
jgi:hypothetical protein